MAETASHADEPVRSNQKGDDAEGAPGQGGDLEGEQLVFGEVMQVWAIHKEAHRHV